MRLKLLFNIHFGERGSSLHSFLCLKRDAGGYLMHVLQRINGILTFSLFIIVFSIACSLYCRCCGYFLMVFKLQFIKITAIGASTEDFTTIFYYQAHSKVNMLLNHIYAFFKIITAGLSDSVPSLFSKK